MYLGTKSSSLSASSVAVGTTASGRLEGASAGAGRRFGLAPRNGALGVRAFVLSTEGSQREVAVAAGTGAEKGGAERAASGATVVSNLGRAAAAKSSSAFRSIVSMHCTQRAFARPCDFFRLPLRSSNISKLARQMSAKAIRQSSTVFPGLPGWRWFFAYFLHNSCCHSDKPSAYSWDRHGTRNGSPVRGSRTMMDPRFSRSTRM